jgi:hypothetical protein
MFLRRAVVRYGLPPPAPSGDAATAAHADLHGVDFVPYTDRTGCALSDLSRGDGSSSGGEQSITRYLHATIMVRYTHVVGLVHCALCM